MRTGEELPCEGNVSPEHHSDENCAENVDQRKNETSHLWLGSENCSILEAPTLKS